MWKALQSPMARVAYWETVEALAVNALLLQGSDHALDHAATRDDEVADRGPGSAVNVADQVRAASSSWSAKLEGPPQCRGRQTARSRPLVFAE